MSTLQGRRAVVVGGSSGIGLATARKFADSGAAVYALARHPPERGEPTGPPGAGEVRFRPVDATDEARVAECFEGILAEGEIDALVYCAGLNIPERSLEQLTADTWRAMLAANLDGAYFSVRSALASLRRRQGVVILVSSASAIWTNQSGAAYQAAKAGLMALARAGNFEEHEHGVRFTTVFPGLVDTPHLDRRPKPPSPQTRQRSLIPDDVAAACAFVAGLPARVCVPEMVLLPTRLQTPGNTCIV